MKPTSQVDAIFSKPARKVERVKSSFNLDKALFDGFKILCEERGVTQSEAIDAMIADLLSRYKTAPAVKSAPPAKKAAI